MAIGSNNMVSQWDFTNKHIDPNIGGADTNSFLSSARCVLYASLSSASADNANNQGIFFRIGVVQGLSFQENKQVDSVFELGSDIPYYVPGRTIGGLSISRILLSGEDFLNMIYRSDNQVVQGSKQFITSLRDPRTNKPFDFLFVYYGSQSNGGFAPSYSRLFKNCFMTARSEGMNAGTVLVAESVSIVYEYISNVSFLGESLLNRS